MGTNETLHDLLLRSAEHAPEQPLFVSKKEVVSYQDLERDTGRFAAALRRQGVTRGDRVALALDNGAEYLTAYYGILKAGAAVVPLCPDTRTSTLSYALNHCEARGVVLGSRNTKLLEGQSGELPHLRLLASVGAPAIEEEGQLKISEYSAMLEEPEPFVGSTTSEDLASIIYTSGTTAKPKGVMLSHGNLVANVRSIVQYLELTAADRIAMVLPFFYSYGNSVLHTHICAGGTVVAVGTMAFPAAVLSGIQEHRCTGLSGVPSTFARMLQSSVVQKFDLSRLRYITQAGCPMAPAPTEKIRQNIPHVAVYVMYGQTEASARLSYLPPADLERKLGSIGMGIPGVTLKIMDEQGSEVTRDTVGEIVAQGANIMQGYWNNPEETARVMRPEGLRTGDLARMDDEGYIWIIGRNSDMIKSGAHRIGPKEIEDAVERLPEIAQCAVTGVPDELLGEAITAFVVPIKGATITRNQVLRICHEYLPRFKMPKHVRVVDSLPRTATGKLRRRELKDWFAEGRGE